MIRRLCCLPGFPTYVVCHGVLAFMFTVSMMSSRFGAVVGDAVDRDDTNFGSRTSSQSYRYSEAGQRFVFRRYDEKYSTDFGGFGTVLLEEKHLLERRRFAVAVLIMKPQTLLLPHYLNGPAIVYVRQGEASVSQISFDESLTNKTVTVGEVHTILAGTLFFVLNMQCNETLQATVLVDLSDVPKDVTLEGYFMAGATFPASILSGFTDALLAAAFKVDSESIRDFLYAQWLGAIIDASDARVEKLIMLMRIRRASLLEQYNENKDNKMKKDKHYCLLKGKHDLENENGWRSTLNVKKCKEFRNMDLGMFAIGLKPGCMVAPHWNPDMTIIGVVTRGKGRVQMVSSEGYTAVDEDVGPGDVFVVPRYHPSTQTTGDGLDFEFIAFATSSEPVRPYYLAGANSVLKSIDAGILSKAFDAEKSVAMDVIEAQPDQVFLASRGTEDEC